MPLLNVGDPFPRLTIETVGGQSLAIPDAFAGDFCRGAVLPGVPGGASYCNAQLRAFERAYQALRDNGIRVVALSVDDKETTAALVARHKPMFPVGYGADAASVAALTGALFFVNPDPVYLQSTWLRARPGRESGRQRVLKPAPSEGGSSPTTSTAWSATCASTRAPATA